MSPLRILPDHSFYTYLICPQGITYNPCPEGSREVVNLKDVISRPFNYVGQNGYLKIRIGWVWGNSGGRGVSFPLITLGYLKGH